MSSMAVAAPAELRDFVESVRRCCAAGLGAPPRSRDEQSLPRPLWRRLGELGVLGLGAGEGEAAWMVAAYRALGSALCPGPLAATAMSAALLTDQSVLQRVRAGDLVVSVGQGGLFPWGLDADLLITTTGDGAWLVDGALARRPMQTLAREPWARIDLAGTRRRPLPGARRAAPIADVAVASLLLGAATTLVEMSAEHARTRQQFGRAIGSFQAVAFAIAAGHAALHNAACLVDAAAQALDSGAEVRALCAGARALASSASLHVARTAHQVHGAMGFTEESPVGAYSTRIRQWSLLPPSPAAGEAALLASIGVDPDSEAQQ